MNFNHKLKLLVDLQLHTRPRRVLKDANIDNFVD